MKKSKKSYMSISNILSEKLTLGSVLKYLKSKPFKKLPKKVDDKKLQSTLRDMNKNVDDITKLLKKMYGSAPDLPKYTIKDLEGEK